MTKVEQIFFSLLKSSLLGTEISLDSFAPISDKEWNEIFELSWDQGMVAILYSVIEKMPKSQFPNMDLVMEWYGEAANIKTQNKDYRKNAAEFLRLLHEEGIECAVLKGMACAKYYPNPDERLLGDLDIFPIKGSYDDINEICSSHGLDVCLHDYKHSKISFRTLAIENHKFCTEIRGEKVKKEFERQLQEYLFNNNEVQFNALFLIAHAFNHFIDEGLSVRQIIDWGMFVKAEQDNIDWNVFYGWMEKMHMKRFADALTAICVDYLSIHIDNKKITTESSYKEKIIQDALYGKMNLHNSGLHGWKYRQAQLCNTFAGAWKFNDICQQNVLIEYI